MIYYHTDRQLLSVDAPLSDRRNRFRVWDQRSNPAAAYAAHGWLPCPESEPVYRNEPLTGNKIRTVAADGQSWSWTVDGQPWQDCVDVVTQVESLRAAKLEELHKWWDTHPGIEVLPDVVLPIQEQGRNTNTAAFTLAMQINSMLSQEQKRAIKLVDINDYTVEVPHTQANAALAVFEDKYYRVSEHWDTTHKAILAATTLAQLQAIKTELQ